MTIRERARGGHGNVSSQEKKDISLVEQTFEYSNKLAVGIFKCPLVVGYEDDMAERERKERDRMSEMETVNQSGVGLHRSITVGVNEEQAYGLSFKARDASSRVESLVPHPITPCRHNIGGDEINEVDWYGADGSRRQPTPLERSSDSGKLINGMACRADEEMGRIAPYPDVLIEIGDVLMEISDEGEAGVNSIAAGVNVDGCMWDRGSDPPSALGASEELVKGGMVDAEDYHIGRVGREGEERERCEGEVRRGVSEKHGERRRGMTLSEIDMCESAMDNPTSKKKEVKMMLTVNAMVNGETLPAMHDTGAEVSVIELKWATKMGMKILPMESTLRILNPNGVPFVCQGVAKEKLLIGENWRSCTLMVVQDLDVPLLLGQDFLAEHEVTLNCGQGIVWYGNELIPTLPVRKQTRKLYRATNGVGLTLEQPLTLAPGQAATVRCVVMENTQRWCSGWTWVVNPMGIVQREVGMTIPEALVEYHGGGGVILAVVNFSTEERTLGCDTLIGSLKTIPREVIIRSVRTSEGSVEASVQRVDDDKAKHKEENLLKFKKTLEEKYMENECLTREQRDEFTLLLMKYESVLQAEQLGTVKSTVFDINVEGAKPIRQRDRRWSQVELAVMKKEIETLTKMGLIEPASGEWASRIVMVTKKDGSTRMCVDFRAVNQLCKMDAYPTPLVERTLDQLNGSHWYTSFDAEKGYYQVAMTERAKEISAFRCPFGYFHFTKMPFGMKNAGATFQRMMDMVLQGLTWQCCMVFVDDVVVYSKTWEDHLRDVGLVLQKFMEFGITLNLKKCLLARNQLPFLGHVVSQEGIKPDPAKVSKVKDFLRPTSVTGLRSFLGMTGQLRKFVKDYAAIARPLNQMLSEARSPVWKGGSVWTSEEEQSFEKLKEAVTEEAFLAHPDFEMPFVLWCDASDYGAGAVLTQEKGGVSRPVAYASAVFNKAQRNYSTTQREGLAVVWATTHYRSYIHGVPTIVVTDHSALTWILSVREPTSRLARWTMALMDYDLTFVHRPGKANVIADALSRLKSRELNPEDPETRSDLLEPIFVGRIRAKVNPKTVMHNDGVVEGDALDEWRKAQRTDPTWKHMVSFLETEIIPGDDACARWISVRSDEFVMLNNLLCKVKVVKERGVLTSKVQVVVPRVMMGRILSRFHEDMAEGGHMGSARLYAKLRERYWWPRMYQDTIDWVASCIPCQRIGKTTAQKSNIGGHVVGEQPLDCIAMDLLAMPESWAGNKYVMVVMDYATRYAIAVPVKDKTAKTVAEALIQQVLLVHGPARRLLSDNGTEFKNQVVAELCRMTNMGRVFTTPYNPQCDGMVERFNRTLLKMVGCYVDEGQKNWDVQLPWLIFAYNTSHSTSHGTTPFELMFGRKVNTTIDLEMEANSRGIRVGEAKLLINDHVHEMRKRAASIIAQNLQQGEITANKHRREPPVFNSGDVVWLHTPWKLDQGAKRKLAPKWRGPYVVVTRIPPVNLRIRPVGSSEKASTVHVDRVKPFRMRSLINGSVETVSENGEVEHEVNPKTKRQSDKYDVEKVGGHRFINGNMQFLLHWKGYNEPTWVQESDMQCHSLVERYFQSNPSLVA